jgi:glutathione S-transferase
MASIYEKELAGAPLAVAGMLTVADIAVGAQLITCQQGGGAIDATRWPGLAAYAGSLVRRPAWLPILAEEEAALTAARARRG